MKQHQFASFFEWLFSNSPLKDDVERCMLKDSRYARSTETIIISQWIKETLLMTVARDTVVLLVVRYHYFERSKVGGCLSLHFMNSHGW